jgi:hypothetical protein
MILVVDAKALGCLSIFGGYAYTGHAAGSLFKWNLSTGKAEGLVPRKL